MHHYIRLLVWSFLMFNITACSENPIKSETDTAHENSVPVAHTIVDMDDPSTYLIAFKGTDLNITLEASDADDDSLDYIVTQPSFGTLSGTAPHLVYRPEVIGMTDSFSFKVNDGVTDSNEVTVAILTLDIAGLMGQLRDRNLLYLNRDISDDSHAKILEIDRLIAMAQVLYRDGYVGNVLILLEQSIRSMAEETLVLEIPELKIDMEQVTYAIYGEIYVYWESVGKGHADEAVALASLNEAKSRSAEMLYAQAVQSLENAYFLLRNIEIPFDADSEEQTLAIMQDIQAEMNTYCEDSARPAYDVIVSIKQTISGQVIWKIEDLIDQGSLGHEDHMILLLDLQDVTQDLVPLDLEGMWSRNWEWGTVQSLRTMIARFKKEASSVLGDDNESMLEIQSALDRGEAYLSTKDVDSMVALYAESSMRCPLLWAYEDAAYKPRIPPADYGCSR